MQPFIGNIEKLTIDNNNFRKVLHTARNSQLVVMSLKPSEEIGLEVHKVDQFIRIEQGNGKAILDGKTSKLEDGSAVIIPAGTNHNIVNTGSKPMKLYTIYSPAEHDEGVVQKTKEQAEKEEGVGELKSRISDHYR